MATKGIVAVSNVVKGIGFIQGEDEKRHFFSHNDLEVPGFRTVIVGKEVSFTPVQANGKDQAKKVSPTGSSGIQIADPLPKGIFLDRNGIVQLRVDTLDRIYAQEDLFPFGEFTIAPSLWGSDGSFRAFRVGGVVKGFTVSLPKPTSARAFLALDPDKNPLPATDGQIRLPLGSYILSLESSGSVRIQTVGKRFQSEKGGGNWVILEHRFQYALDLQQDIEGQFPTTSGLSRDNDGFIPGVRAAAAMLTQQAEMAAP